MSKAKYLKGWILSMTMHRRRNLTTNKITKYKARLNINGGKQEYRVNYYETYAPIVTWFARCLVIVFAILFGWALRQVDFILAYMQAPIEVNMYMELPQGIETTHGSSKTHVLQLISNLYGQKQAGRVWNQYLVDKLFDAGYVQSSIDDCVFYKGNILFIVYVDDGIFLGASEEQLVREIKLLQGLNLDIEDQGHPSDYVGINIQHHKDGSYNSPNKSSLTPYYMV